MTKIQKHILKMLKSRKGHLKDEIYDYKLHGDRYVEEEARLEELNAVIKLIQEFKICEYCLYD